MARILSIGVDASLLATRHQVLQLTGAEVTTSTPEEAAVLLEAQRFDVVLLCHATPEDQVVSLCELLERCCPETRIVRLERPDNRALPGTAKARPFDWQRGPAALVAFAKGLLITPPPGVEVHQAVSREAQLV